MVEKTRVYLVYVVILAVVIGAFSLPIIIMRILNPLPEGPELLIPNTGAGSVTPTNSPTATATTIETATHTPTATSSITPSLTFTFTPMGTASATPTATPSRTLIPPTITNRPREPKPPKATATPQPTDPPPTEPPQPTDPPATDPPAEPTIIPPIVLTLLP